MREFAAAGARVTCAAMMFSSILVAVPAAAAEPAATLAAGQVFWPMWVDGKASAAANANGVRYSIGPRAVDGYDFHAGLDLPAASGTPVYAVADGTVTAVNAGSGTEGNQVIVDHGSGRFTVYDHLNDTGFPKVKIGAKAVAGVTQLGNVGDTGAPPGNFHLHLTYIFAPGFAGTHSKEMLARLPFEFLPHVDTTAADIDVKFQGSAVAITLPITATVTRFVVAGNGQTRILDYYQVLSEGNPDRNNTVQGGLNIAVTPPFNTVGHPATGGSITLTLDTAPAGAFFPDQVVLYDYAGNIVYQKKTVPNRQGVWWGGAAQTGWGLSLIQSGEQIGAGWYHFGTDGAPAWLIMPGCTWMQTADAQTCSGTLFRSSGAPFGNYNTASFSQQSVGTASFVFPDSNADHATLQYQVDGIAGSIAIERLVFGGGASPAAFDGTGIWWGGPAQNGWGIALYQQGASVGGAWYTYGNDGKATWFLIAGGEWKNATTWSGRLIAAHGAPLIGTAYNAAMYSGKDAGSVSIAFSDASNAVLTYSVGGVEQSKPLTRLGL